MKNCYLIHASMFATALLLAGCQTMPYVTEGELDRAPMTAAIEAQDVRRTVEKMADSLLADPGVVEFTNGSRPVLDIEPMKNHSDMILDMQSITDSIRMRLIRSRMFRFVDRSTSGADISIMDEQAQLGLTDQRQAIRGGQQTAAQMFLTGSLSVLGHKVNGTTDRYYKFTMILKDLRSGEIVWTDEQEIRKVARRSLF